MNGRVVGKWVGMRLHGSLLRTLKQVHIRSWRQPHWFGMFEHLRRLLFGEPRQGNYKWTKGFEFLIIGTPKFGHSFGSLKEAWMCTLNELKWCGVWHVTQFLHSLQILFLTNKQHKQKMKLSLALDGVRFLLDLWRCTLDCKLLVWVWLIWHKYIYNWFFFLVCFVLDGFATWCFNYGKDWWTLAHARVYQKKKKVDVAFVGST